MLQTVSQEKLVWFVRKPHVVVFHIQCYDTRTLIINISLFLLSPNVKDALEDSNGPYQELNINVYLTYEYAFNFYIHT